MVSGPRARRGQSSVTYSAAATALKQFVDYALGAGQDVLGQLQYGKLPPALLSQAKSAAGTLQCNGSAL